METERCFSIPDSYRDIIAANVKAEGLSLTKPEELAKAVMRLSDFYKDNPNGQTPWHQTWARVAYMIYFFPLNYIRAAAVIAEGKKSRFFDGIDSWTDFGSGCGTVSCAAADAGIFQQAQSTMIERAQAAIDLHKKLQPEFKGSERVKFRISTPADPLPQVNRHLSSFSYSLTELNKIPDFAKNSSAYMIIEPATRDDSRRLLNWRQSFIDDGYDIHAPCTHLAPCPLLIHSERDWCHDRISFAAPGWFLAVEKHLPIKNKTLTFSYLLARKSKDSLSPKLPKNCGRLTGDLMKEKGASRQMFCRGPAREFLSWQHKLGKPPHFPRGAVVTYPDDITVKSNELRPNADDITLFENSGSPANQN